MTQPSPTHKIRARLYVDTSSLQAGQFLQLEENNAHYLLHTLRAKEDDKIAVFNGKDGEWLARVSEIHKRSLVIEIVKLRKAQQACPPIGLVFAPVKNDKIDFMVKRAVELGVSYLQPIMTQHTIVSRVNMERLRANAIEASEQCERLDIPAIHEPLPLTTYLSQLSTRAKPLTLLYGDEDGNGATLRTLLPSLPIGEYAALIGPEGGFSVQEREILHKLPYVRAISLGPRILRAETAALAALANIQAWLGDWDKPSSFSAT